MTFTELLTIYLAIGAPFGVYNFLKQRRKSYNIALFAKSIFVTLLWFLFIARLLKQKLAKPKTAFLGLKSYFSRNRQIEIAGQNLLILLESFSSDVKTFTFFETRETLERYIGLTLAAQNSSASSPAAQHELEIFRVVKRNQRDLNLAARISHRKNYQRLQIHQSLARHDFLRICLSLEEMSLAKYLGKIELLEQYQKAAITLCELLGDETAIRVLRKLPENISDRLSPPVEDNHEWKPDLWKTPPAQPPSTSIKKLPQTT